MVLQGKDPVEKPGLNGARQLVGDVPNLAAERRRSMGAGSQIAQSFVQIKLQNGKDLLGQSRNTAGQNDVTLLYHTVFSAKCIVLFLSLLWNLRKVLWIFQEI